MMRAITILTGLALFAACGNSEKRTSNVEASSVEVADVEASNMEASDIQPNELDQTHDFVSDGMMRTERAPLGLPVSQSQALRNFREIFFYSEYAVEDGRYVLRRDPIPLEKRKWDTTWLLVGQNVTERDRQHVDHVAGLIETATGIAIREVARGADILIAIVDAEEREDMADWMEDSYGETGLTRDLRNDLGDDLCLTVPFGQEDEDKDEGFLIIIPNEVKGLPRRSCIEEEFTHAFGPSADFDQARPSIFNDDREFALLTAHDLMLLRILYDPRLKAGMTEQEALPILRRIVAEVVPEVPPKSGDIGGGNGETKTAPPTDAESATLPRKRGV